MPVSISCGHYVSRSLASRPYYVHLDGDMGKLGVVDPTPDGGRLIVASGSGRRIRPDHVPTRAKRKGGSLKVFPHLQFDQFFARPFVSDRLRDLIETLEPGVHKFFTVEVTIGKDYVALRHLLNVCNRLDTLHPTLTFPRDDRGFYKGVTGEPCRIVHIAEAVAGHHLWHEKFAGGLFASDELVGQMVERGVTGLYLGQRHEAA